MSGLSFFPKLDDIQISNCGYQSSDYDFFYYSNGQQINLKQSKLGFTVTLHDVNDAWKIENEGLAFTKSVKIEYPYLLKGSNGVICKDGELGVCIIWNNNYIPMRGYIFPEEIGDSNHNSVSYLFKHEFYPGEIKGGLELSVVLYIKERAAVVQPDEENLINESGILLGEFETIKLDVSSMFLDFPIEECHDIKAPLWWARINWDDATEDRFSKENICIYLNTAYKGCPRFDTEISNFELLIDIISTTYLMIFKRLNDAEKNVVLTGGACENDSICNFLRYFILNSENGSMQIDANDEDLLLNIQKTVINLLSEGDKDENQ